jgi:hypothetical protein
MVFRIRTSAGILGVCHQVSNKHCMWKENRGTMTVCPLPISEETLQFALWQPRVSHAENRQVKMKGDHNSKSILVA